MSSGNPSVSYALVPERRDVTGARRSQVNLEARPIQTDLLLTCTRAVKSVMASIRPNHNTMIPLHFEDPPGSQESGSGQAGF